MSVHEVVFILPGLPDLGKGLLFSGVSRIKSFEPLHERFRIHDSIEFKGLQGGHPVIDKLLVAPAHEVKEPLQIRGYQDVHGG